MILGIKSILELSEDELKKQYLALDHLHIDGLIELQNSISGNMKSSFTGLGIGMSLAYRKAIERKEFNDYIKSVSPTIEYLSNDDFIVELGDEKHNIGQGKGLKLSNEILGFNPNDIRQKYDIEKLSTIQHFSTRLKSALISENENIHVLPFINEIIETNTFKSKNRVVEMVINNFPTIEKNIPWKELSEFKKEFKTERWGLKNWINDISKQDLTASELEDKLTYEIEILRKRYKLLNKKGNNSILKITFLTTAKITQDILRLKFGDAVEKIFSINEKRISLLEEEINMPNKELSYLIKVEQKFC